MLVGNLIKMKVIQNDYLNFKTQLHNLLYRILDWYFHVRPLFSIKHKFCKQARNEDYGAILFL